MGACNPRSVDVTEELKELVTKSAHAGDRLHIPQGTDMGELLQLQLEVEDGDESCGEATADEAKPVVTQELQITYETVTYKGMYVTRVAADRTAASALTTKRQPMRVGWPQS